LVLELASGKSPRQEPEFVIPFCLSPEEAEAHFRRWLDQTSLLNPSDLLALHHPEPVVGLYLPFWGFHFGAKSTWKASIGERWTQKVKATRRTKEGKNESYFRHVQRTEWFPLEGRHEAYHHHTVPAGKGLPDSHTHCIGEFRLEGLKPYTSAYLAGWASEEASRSGEAAATLSQREIMNREQSRVRNLLPGDTHWWLRVHTELEERSRFLLFAPVYLLTYHYAGHNYRFFLNGQTGVHGGERPWAWGRLGRLMLVLLLLGAALALWNLGRPT
jgi:hypothetical protein